jgi:hypothetical protein
VIKAGNSTHSVFNSVVHTSFLREGTTTVPLVLPRRSKCGDTLQAFGGVSSTIVCVASILDETDEEVNGCDVVESDSIAQVLVFKTRLRIFFSAIQAKRNKWSTEYNSSCISFFCISWLRPFQNLSINSSSFSSIKEYNKVVSKIT